MTKKIKIIGFLCVISFLLGGCGIKDKIKLTSEQESYNMVISNIGMAAN